MNAQERQILADMARRLENLITLGSVAELDHPGRRLRVQSGELLTDWLPWPAEMGRNHIRWRPLRLGQQLILACPSGDPAQAAIIGQLYSASMPPPSTDENLDIVQWEDGSLVSYDSAAHRYTITVNGGDLQLNATGNVNATIGGNANVTASGDINMDATKIQLNSGVGVVTGECICALTGLPHSDKSSQVTAGK